jgi:hypothetical protein
MISPIEVQLLKVGGQQSPHEVGGQLLEKDQHYATILSIIKYFSRIQNMDFVEKIVAILGLNPFSPDVSNGVDKGLPSSSSPSATATATTTTTSSPSSSLSSVTSAATTTTTLSGRILKNKSIEWYFILRTEL